MKNKFFIVLFMSLFIFTACDDLEYDTNLDRVINSPDNSYSLTLRYDYVSRPSIFKDGKLIYEYPGSGFTETVGWDIKWVSDDETANDYSFVFNYDILSRVGNPQATVTCYINELAIFPYGIKEVGTNSTSTFVWDEEGNLVLFESTGWYFAESASFEFEYYRPKKL